jgi:hypothetical protein
MVNSFFVSNSLYPLRQLLVVKRLFLISIEYKVFTYEDDLYILLGDANYMLVPLPEHVEIICKKKKIFFFSLIRENFSINNRLLTFFNILRNLKNLNIYKGKGVIPTKNFKLVKLKKGKRQQFI